MTEFQQISKHQENKHLTNAAVLGSQKCEHCCHHYWKGRNQERIAWEIMFLGHILILLNLIRDFWLQHVEAVLVIIPKESYESSWELKLKVFMVTLLPVLNIRSE